MTRRSTFMMCIPAALLLAAAGCSRPSEQPTTTETKGGASTAPSGTAAAARDNSMIRMVHAVAAAPAVDLYHGDTATFSAVAFRNVTPYKEVPGGPQALRIRPAGQSAAAPLAENMEGLRQGIRYTAIAIAGKGDEAPSLRVINDDLAAPVGNKAKVRVIHAAAAAPAEVELFVTGQKEALIDDIGYNNPTTFKEVDPMTGTLEIHAEGSRAVALRIPKTSIEAGNLYTFIVVGGKQPKQLSVIPIIDKPAGAPGA